MTNDFPGRAIRRRPSWVATIDLDGLSSLIGRLARLRQELEEINKGRPADYDENSVERLGAAGELTAVLSFLEDSESLTPHLHRLLNALLDVERGRPVAWLKPGKRGRPPPRWTDVAVHARCAWVMDFLMQKTRMDEEEAARFVVKHGELRTWLARRSQQNSAADWRVVANWRDRINGGSCTEEERIAFEATAEIANLRLATPQGVEREAKKLLRAFKKSILVRG